jgi:hypothetical protein
VQRAAEYQRGERPTLPAADSDARQAKSLHASEVREVPDDSPHAIDVIARAM